MFLPPYFVKYLKSNSALNTAIGGHIYFKKCPSAIPGQSVRPTSYIVVCSSEDYDHGTVCAGVLTTKLESFTIILVAPSVPILQGLWLKLTAAIDACREQTVTSTDLGGTIKIQSVITDADGAGEMHDGLILAGEEITSPCIVINQRGSYSGPVLTP